MRALLLWQWQSLQGLTSDAVTLGLRISTRRFWRDRGVQLLTPAIPIPLLAPSVQQMSLVIRLVLLSFLERPLSARHPPFQRQNNWKIACGDLCLMNVGKGLFLVEVNTVSSLTGADTACFSRYSPPLTVLHWVLKVFQRLWMLMSSVMSSTTTSPGF